jgi:predicted GNAT family acetyltransferase
MMSEVNVIHNETGRRFEVRQEGLVATLTYEREGGKIKLVDTQVPEALGGRGIGGALAKAGLEYARAQGLAVEVICPFVQSYLKKHPELG